MAKLVKILQDAVKNKQYVNIVLGNGHTYGGIPIEVDAKGNFVTLDTSPHAIQTALLDHIVVVQLVPKQKAARKTLAQLAGK